MSEAWHPEIHSSLRKRLWVRCAEPERAGDEFAIYGVCEECQRLLLVDAEVNPHRRLEKHKDHAHVLPLAAPSGACSLAPITIFSKS